MPIHQNWIINGACDLRRPSRHINKVQLINPPSITSSESASAHCFPPLGLLSIATVIKRECPDVVVEILDGSIMALDRLIGKLDADLVGVSALATTYPAAIQIAREARLQGSFVIMGNDHASLLSRIILERRPEVDAILAGDFVEVPFAKMVTRLRAGILNPSEIPGLCWIDSSDIYREISPLQPKMGSLPIPNRSLMDHKPYSANFNRQFALKHGYCSSVTTVNNARGCSKNRNRCLFCSIYDLTLCSSPATRFWNELLMLKESGFDFVWEVCDDFSSFCHSTHNNPSYLDELLDAKPAGEMPRLFVYARASQLDRSILERLCNLGVAKLNIGMESGDIGSLRAFRKGSRRGPEDNIKAVEEAARLGIHVHGSFVLGSIGETKESLQHTLDLCHYISRYQNVTSFDPSVLLPLPGAPAWRCIQDLNYAQAVASPRGIEVSSLDRFGEFIDNDLLETDKLASSDSAT